MREDYFHTVIFNHVMHYFALPLCCHLPLRQVAFQNHIRVIPCHLAGWNQLTNILNDFFEQRFWLPYRIVHTAHSTRCPDTYIAAVFRNFQHTECAMYRFHTVGSWHYVHNVRGVYIVFQYSDRFIFCFICIHRYFIVFTAFIFQNQAVAHHFATQCQHYKFFGISRYFKAPLLWREYRRNGAGAWEVCQIPHQTSAAELFGGIFKLNGVGNKMSRCGITRYFIQFCIFFIIFCHQFFCFRTLRRFLRQAQIA